MYSRHQEYAGMIQRSPDEVYAYLDDQTRLSSHMTKRSWKMGWGRMETVLDAQHGQAVGSHILLRGRVFGVRLYLDEVVVKREPPRTKAWETVGEPRLLVIGSYRMGFDVVPDGPSVKLRVMIDYALPEKGISRVLGLLFGRWYAQWCTRQMVRDAQHAFA